MISNEQFKQIENFIYTTARPIDVALYDFYFHEKAGHIVISALKEYQNEDGGFGNAIEPDMRLPHSTALGTWMAFQYIKETDITENNDVVQDAIKYFISSFDKEKSGWDIVCPEVDEYPHAPWWDYNTAMNHFGWGNPSAEILGLLVKYAPTNAVEIKELLKKRALERIQQVDPANFHEVFCFKALYELCDEDLRSKLQEPLTKLILAAVNTNVTEWNGYVATPIKFVHSKGDPFLDLFDKELINENIEFIIKQISVDHWEPNWNWGDNYPDAWNIAKAEWSGHITVRNLITLKKFSII